MKNEIVKQILKDIHDDLGDLQMNRKEHRKVDEIFSYYNGVVNDLSKTEDIDFSKDTEEQ